MRMGCWAVTVPAQVVVVCSVPSVPCRHSEQQVSSHMEASEPYKHGISRSPGIRVHACASDGSARAGWCCARLGPCRQGVHAAMPALRWNCAWTDVLPVVVLVVHPAGPCNSRLDELRCCWLLAERCFSTVRLALGQDSKALLSLTLGNQCSVLSLAQRLIGPSTSRIAAGADCRHWVAWPSVLGPASRPLGCRLTTAVVHQVGLRERSVPLRELNASLH